MTDIPNDVVERALEEYRRHLAYNPIRVFAMRAAGRVFVEWERERCARKCREIADGFTAYRDHYPHRDGALECERSIRSRAQSIGETDG